MTRILDALIGAALCFGGAIYLGVAVWTGNDIKIIAACALVALGMAQTARLH